METRKESRPAVDARRDVERDQKFCFACGSTQLSILDRIVDRHASTGYCYALVICGMCGSGRLKDALTTEQLEALYPETFHSYKANERRFSFARLVLKLRYDRHRFRPKFSSLLEIGCGSGEFLATIKERGSVVGLERAEAARLGGRKLGVDVRVGDVTNSNLFSANAFDFIYLSHAFEHLDDPAAALTSMHRWLTDDGRLFIAVPNFGGLIPRVSPRNWYNLAVPLHVSQFTRRGIRTVLESNGFRVDRIVCNSDPLSLPMTAYLSRASVDDFKGWRKLLVFVVALLCIPISRLLDFAGFGDCIEVHARKI